MEIAHHLASKAPALIILAVRSVEKGNIARDEVLSRLPKDHKTTIEVWSTDMADFSSVIAFGKRCKGLKRIDGVAMNAGILGGGPWEITKDGHEIV